MFYDGGGALTAVFVVFFFVFFFSSSALFLLNEADWKADAARGGCVVLSPKTIALVDNINKNKQSRDSRGRLALLVQLPPRREHVGYLQND